jgi:hypothetical protein
MRPGLASERTDGRKSARIFREIRVVQSSYRRSRRGEWQPCRNGKIRKRFLT